jgi:hypothetical protein
MPSSNRTTFSRVVLLPTIGVAVRRPDANNPGTAASSSAVGLRGGWSMGQVRDSYLALLPNDPPPAGLCIRGGWSMGQVRDSYILAIDTPKEQMNLLDTECAQKNWSGREGICVSFRATTTSSKINRLELTTRLLKQSYGMRFRSY